MEDISLHVLDILENSAKAGATKVELIFGWRDAALNIGIRDNGPGLPDHVAAAPADPYTTTRTERPVGLGLALLKQSAEESGGCMTVESQPGRGVAVQVEFLFGGPDAKPLGDIIGTLSTAVLAWPGADMKVLLALGTVVLDMTIVKAETDGIPLSHPAVRGFIKEALQDGLADLLAWAEQGFNLR
ncbi:MAG: ATP-binding protein [Lentisphaeria bacterium]|nr:ATP-binding protein [Lentisphaeria bacterium]